MHAKNSLPGSTGDAPSESLCTDGSPVAGTWNPGGDFNILITWTLEQASCGPAFDVSVYFYGQEIVDIVLDGSDPEPTQFSVSKEDGSGQKVYGNIQVTMSADDCDPLNTISLMAEVSDDCASPNPMRTLAAYSYYPLEPISPDFQPIPDNIPSRVVDTSISPYCFSGQLAMTFEDGKTYIGTATVIRSIKHTGLYLLTCAHNVYDAVSGEPTSVIFYPGLNSDPDSDQHCIEPIPAVSWYFPSAYVGVATTRKIDRSLLSHEMLASITQYDYAVVKLATPVPGLPSPVPTVRQATDAELKCDRAITLNGLYGWIEDYDMYSSSGVINTAAGALTATQLQYDASTAPGSSGTAVAWGDHKKHFIGVHNGSGPSTKPLYNVGHRFDQISLQNIAHWLTK